MQDEIQPEGQQTLANAQDPSGVVDKWWVTKESCQQGDCDCSMLSLKEDDEYKWY